ncbi:MAG: hypothetical protein U0W65_15455 [Bacteroidia bacterium]
MASFIAIPVVLITKVYLQEGYKNVYVYSILLFTEYYLLLTNFRFVVLFIRIIKT